MKVQLTQVNLSVTYPEFQIMIAHLQEGRYKDVGPLMNKIADQVKQQVEAANAAEAAVETQRQKNAQEAAADRRVE